MTNARKDAVRSSRRFGKPASILIGSGSPEGAPAPDGGGHAPLPFKQSAPVTSQARSSCRALDPIGAQRLILSGLGDCSRAHAAGGNGGDPLLPTVDDRR